MSRKAYRPRKNPNEGMVINYRRRVRRNKIKRRLALFVLLSMIIIAVTFFAPWFKIRKITITGLNDQTAGFVQNYANSLVSKNINFYKLENIEKVLMQSQYVQSAKVSKKLPNTLLIDITPSEPYAKIFTKGAYMQIDNLGRVLEYSYVDNLEIAQIWGFTELKLDVGKSFTNETLPVWQSYLDVFSQISKHSLRARVKTIDFTDTSNIKIKIDNLDVKIGDTSQIDYKFKMILETINYLPQGIRGEIDATAAEKVYFKEIFENAQTV
jgi:cell division protein FtsQ